MLLFHGPLQTSYLRLGNIMIVLFVPALVPIFLMNSVLSEKYQLMEIEKKKVKPVKKEYAGPMIRYHSVRMPLIEEVPVVEPPAPIQGDMVLDNIQVSLP